MEPKELMHVLKQMIDEQRTNQISKAIMGYGRIKDLLLCIDHEGKNIFFRAIEIKQQQLCLKTLEFLVKNGGDIRHKDINKQSIIYFAARHEKELVVKYLLSFNFPLNDDDYFMQTPLFYTAKFNKTTKTSEMLLKAGCDANHKDGNGQTCIFYSVSVGNLQITRLLVEYGATVQIFDKNREKPSSYARKNGHTKISEYLHNCKNQLKRVKEQHQVRRVQESSQNTVEPRKKKQISKNQYCLVYTNQNGQTKVLTYSELLKFKAASEQNQKLFRLMFDPEESIEGLGSIPDKKFQRLSLKILNYFMKLQNSHHFLQPVNYNLHQLYDYTTIVKYPMDFGTIKKKLVLNAYLNESQFQQDMNLVFDNCILYNGTEQDLGKIALQMKMEFNTMFVKQFSA